MTCLTSFNKLEKLIFFCAANLKKQKVEKEEEKLRESLERKRSLIRRHKRKNWACYTMLLSEIYGILRRRDTIEGECLMLYIII